MITPRERPGFEPPADLSAADLARLESRLASPAFGGRAMDIHQLQGLFVALALGPRLLTAGVWMPWVWDAERGTREPTFADADDAEAVFQPLMHFYNATMAALGPAASDAEAAAFRPLFLDGTPAAVANFAAGWRRAIDLAPDDWAPVRAEWPQWMDLIESRAPDAAALAAVLAPMRRYWRGRSDRLEPLHAGPRDRRSVEPAPAGAPGAPQESDVIAHLHRALARFERPFPSEAIALAERHREQVAPWLIKVVESVGRDPAAAIDGEDDMLHVFAMALLGHWRDTRAWRPLLAWARLPSDTLEALLGDSLTETYGRAVASVCDADLQPLAELARDESLDIWARTALLEAWQVRVIEGDAPREPLEDLLLELGQREADGRPGRAKAAHPHLDLLEEIVGVAGDVAAPRLREPVHAWFAEGLIDTRVIDLADYEQAFNLPAEQRREQLRARGRTYLRDPEREIGWWAAYHEDEDDEAYEPLPQRLAPAETTIVREGPKIGRNDPCPCGSGRKYKKCHGAG